MAMQGGPPPMFYEPGGPNRNWRDRFTPEQLRRDSPGAMQAEFDSGVAVGLGRGRAKKCLCVNCGKNKASVCNRCAKGQKIKR